MLRRQLSTLETQQNAPTRRPRQARRRTSLGTMEDLVQCALCLEQLTDPKMFPCQHTFCFSCLQLKYPKGEKQIKCPTCEMTVQLGIESLPPNMHIITMLNILAGKPSAIDKLEEEIRCAKCQTVCGENQFQTCRHCKQNFCLVCWTGHMSELKVNIVTLMDQIKEAEVLLKNRLQGFKDKCDELTERINSVTEQKIIEIRAKEAIALEQTAEFKRNGEEETKKLQSMLDELKLEGNIHKFDSITNGIEKVNMFLELHRNTGVILKEISRWGEVRAVFDKEKFKIELESEVSVDAEADDADVAMAVKMSSNPLESPESLLVYYRSRVFSPRLIWTKCLHPAGVGIPPWSEQSLFIAATDSRTILVLDITKNKLVQRITSPEMIFPHSIAFSSSRKEVYVTDKWKHCIHVFNRSGEYLRSLCSKGHANGLLRSPEGITVANDGNIYVCDTGNDRIQILHPDTGDFIRQFGIHEKDVVSNTKSGNKIVYKSTEFNSPTGIASSGDQIIVADNGNRRIKTYTLDGTKLLEFGSLGKQKGQFKSPEVVSVDPMGFIFVGDSGNARVQIFKPNGSLARVFGGLGQKGGKFGWVSGICVTPKLDVIVTDSKYHTVQIF